VTQQASFVVPLAPMLSAAACRGLDVRGESAAQAAAAVGVNGGVLRTGVRVVSPLGVSDEADCVPGAGPGACLVVEDRSSYRCFGLADVRAGRALARTAEGLIAGVVPDDVDRVTLTAHGHTARAIVVDNVYEARLGVPSGTPVRVALDRLWDDACPRAVAPGLLARVATLRRQPDDRMSVPQAVRRALDGGSQYRFDGELLRGARRWGSDGGVEFWAVPVAARGADWCAPANAVCVVAVPPGSPADAACMPRPNRNPEFWRVAPLPSGNAAIFGVVADDVIGARVTAGTLTAQVNARENLIGGVLRFPYKDGVRVDLIHRTAP
jgi:hypothetical protein